MALALALGAPAVTAQTEGKERPLSPFQMKQTERAQLESMLKAELQRTVDSQKRIEGQGKHPLVLSARFERRDEFGRGANTPWLIVDISKGYLPRNPDYNRGVRHMGADFEDILSELHNTAYELLLDVVHIKGVEFLFDGRDIYHYYPEDSPPEYFDPSHKDAVSSAATSTVVVAAGHGIYRNYGSVCGLAWCPQRDEHNGITEDFVTPGYAAELKKWLIERSHETVTMIGNPRSKSTDTHQPSGQPWWKLGARYSLEASYPDSPEIWHSLPNNTGHLRERNEDIRSRPLFANHIGAGTILHLHTNAANPSATGVRVLFHTGRAIDEKLGNSILCYMKELIHAQEPYEDYTVPNMAIPRNDLGENSLAHMPPLL
ncbi:N-acetylmuramoyl-L-alanine amidase [Marilutibacter spongiae]|uniref:N-acetylmuramoyl-L-alanine amidase n=1 Tax=Marilutibacter spongiae TaxID=2025720 RepID=A0A7W3TNL3_9GAMM|nr:N-acetylmuramoyl-L-alanine amidase [Lysobacter spongiae]MBB1061264.1 N-acetylmuramoyl-L-alanine amidase [Lysobacter spongiae]